MTSEQLNIVLNELQSRGILIDEWEQVFGSQSFDEVLTTANREVRDSERSN